jgi:FKBP-type peptidyl-prolyl cis-trans isomerase SlyD
MRIASQKVATIDYTLSNEAGELIDSSEDVGPLTYLHGTGNIVPGLESALEGKEPGDRLQVTVAPGQAYGERREDLVQAVPRENFPEGEIEVGMLFRGDTHSGESHFLRVVAVETTQVTVDANHPLAGKTLAFDVTVRSVRDATPEEIEHGHVHEPGHHHH